MKIGYFADGPWSHKAIEKIFSNNNFQIAFIVPRYDTQDPILKEWSRKLDVDFIPLEDVNSLDSLEILKKYDADLFVSMSFNQILKANILNLPKKGFINCHAGALPFYRGRNILNWALINDEKEFGVTVHYIDEGIDTGDIILQRMAKITDQDSYKTLLERAINLCAESLFDAICELALGKVNRIEQNLIDPVGTYFGRRREGDEWLDWNWSSRKIFNFIRAITNPGPCARTLFEEQNLKVRSSLEIKGASNYTSTAGEIVGRNKDYLVVKTGDATIMIPRSDSVCEKNDSILRSLRIGSRLKGYHS